LRCSPCLDPRDLDRHRAAPFGSPRATIGTPFVVSRHDQVALTIGAASAFVVRMRLATPTPFSPRRRRSVRQHVERSAPGPASCRRFALRFLVRHDARCIGPTSAFSRLRTSTRASLVPRCVMRFRACTRWGIACSRQCDSLRWAAHSLEIRRLRACCSRVTRTDRTSDIPVASPS